MSRIPDFASLPRAHETAVATGRIRVQPEDFVVREWLGFEADGEGPHLLLMVRKRGANTHWVARALAQRAGVHPREVGFAGLKDRDAVTEQAFTVPAQKTTPEEWLGFSSEGFDVIKAARQRRKLKRGAHKGNDFRIVIRDLAAGEALDERLALIGRNGVPNYFGPQRFGREGRNLVVADRWFSGGEVPYDRAQRGFALSAARSALFNSVLAARIGEQSWNRLQTGDVANLDGSGSVFTVPALDEVLIERCGRLDIHPTGPLWGRGESRTGEAIANLERACVEPWAHWAQGLVSAGLEQERRALRLNVQNLHWTRSGTDLELSFRLGRGAFATAVLAEFLVQGDVELDESED